jgi:hypothetical protein
MRRIIEIRASKRTESQRCSDQVHQLIEFPTARTRNWQICPYEFTNLPKHSSKSATIFTTVYISPIHLNFSHMSALIHWISPVWVQWFTHAAPLSLAHCFIEFFPHECIRTWVHQLIWFILHECISSLYSSLFSVWMDKVTWFHMSASLDSSPYECISSPDTSCISSLDLPSRVHQVNWFLPHECITWFLSLRVPQFTWFLMHQFTWFFPLPHEYISTFDLSYMSASVHLNPPSVVDWFTKWINALCTMLFLFSFSLILSLWVFYLFTALRAAYSLVIPLAFSQCTFSVNHFHFLKSLLFFIFVLCRV